MGASTTPDHGIGRRRIGLVGCVKSKAASRVAARDLYVSPLFRGRRAYVEASCESWFILSAKHGLVDPDELIDPYDETLTDRPPAARRNWSLEVLQALLDRLGPVGHVEFEVHAGAAYRNSGLVDGLTRRGASVVVPTVGLTQGEQLAFYRRSRSVRRSHQDHRSSS